LQLAELLKLTDEHIALVFRIPLQILGLGSAPLGSTEALMSFWLASGLGFALNHIEQAFDKLFGLSGEPDDYCEFNTSALLRSAEKDRIDALVRGVQGGVFSPNEARNLEGLNSVEYGDEPRVHCEYSRARDRKPQQAYPTPRPTRRKAIRPLLRTTSKL